MRLTNPRSTLRPDRSPDISTHGRSLAAGYHNRDAVLTAQTVQLVAAGNVVGAALADGRRALLGVREVRGDVGEGKVGVDDEGDRCSRAWGGEAGGGGAGADGTGREVSVRTST